jgi:hypothetical protein
MALEDLTNIEFIEGLFALLTLTITVSIGIGVMYKFKKTDNNKLIPVGLFWALMGSPWLSASITFVMYIFLDYGLPGVLYVFLAAFIYPITLLIWIHSYGILTELEKRKALFYFYCVVAISFYIPFLLFLFSGDPILVALVGVKEAKFNIKFGYFVLFFGLFGFLSIFITGMHFSIKTMRIDDKLIKWKGKLLAMAFILYTTGLIADSFVPTIYPFFTALFRGLVILSGVFFYLAFFLPKRLADAITKS